MNDPPEDFPDVPRTWTAALRIAASSDEHTVELVSARHGLNVEIDGVPMFPHGGYPIETFTMANRDEWVELVTDEMVEKIEEVTDGG